MEPLHQSDPAPGKVLDKSTLLAMPPNRETVVEEVGDELVLTRPRGWRPLGVVLLLILAFYTYIPIAGLLDAMGIAPLLGSLRPDERFRPRPPDKPINLRGLPIGLWIAPIPIVVGWPFLIAWTAGHLTGFDQVRIGPGGVEHRRGTLLRRRRRSVPLNEVRGVISEEHFDDRSLIVTWGPPILLGGDWAHRKEREWLTDLVRRKLLDLKSRDRSSPTPSCPPTLTVSLAPPRVTFSTLHQEDTETDTLDRISGCGGCLVPTLFLNVMIVICLLAVFTPFQWRIHWHLLLPLIPCLFMAFVTILKAYDTFAWSVWTFDAEEVAVGYYFLGVPIGPKDHYATDLLGSVELKTVIHSDHAHHDMTSFRSKAGEPYPLSPLYWLELKGRDGKPLNGFAVIPREALWLMREVSVCLKGTLNKSETTLTLPPAPANSLWDREHDL